MEKKGDRKDDDLIKKKERCGDLLHTTNTFNSSFSSKFGTFILLTETVYKNKKLNKYLRKPSIFMLSSEYESIDSVLSGGTSGSNDEDDDGTSGSNDQDDDDHDGQMGFKLRSLRFPLLLLADYEYCAFNQNIVVGSCNGLVCLHVSMLQQIYLWNPVTQELKILPKSITVGENDRFSLKLVAFGFDVETKDFKVMILTCLRRDYYRTTAPPIDCPCRVQVYSLSTNSWRLSHDIDSLPGDPFSKDPREPIGVVYLNGSCFFLAHHFHAKEQRCLHQNNRLIISFDFTKEIFTPIQLPDHHQRQRLYLSCWGDKMALFTVCRNPPPRPHYPDIYELPLVNDWHFPEIYEPPRGRYWFEIRGYEDYNIWVLDEQVSSSSSVDKESWKQLHFFQIELQEPDEWSSPSCISDDAELVLLETRYKYKSTQYGLCEKMKLYNVVTRKVKDFLRCNRVMSKAYAYKPSLVSMVEKGQQQQPIG